jgi:SLOG family YspA-like protein
VASDRPTKVLVTGDRNWTDERPILAVLRRLHHHGAILVHGAASGADRIAADLADSMAWEVRPYPADWTFYGKAAGPIRNRLMLKRERPTLVIGFHDHIEKSKGTRDMCSIALHAGVRVFLFSHTAGWQPYAEPVGALRHGA